VPEELTMRVIARIRSDFSTKFGIPRQSGLVQDLKAAVVFEPEYRSPDALRGLEEYTHIWLIWQFSQAVREDGSWTATVRPPRLGGNVRMGVFATRSPFRPNAIGLSSVRLDGVEPETPEGPVLHVSGADLLDGTPILDIKPYLPFTDAHPEAADGFASRSVVRPLEVHADPRLLEQLPPERRAALLGVLRQDPRPAYQNDPERVYGLEFAGFDVKFTVDSGILTVCGLAPLAVR